MYSQLDLSKDGKRYIAVVTITEKTARAIAIEKFYKLSFILLF